MGGDFCEGCPAGKYTQTYNARACISCDAGQYAELSEYGEIETTGIGNFHGCVVCPSGKWQSGSATTDCSDCRIAHHDKRGGVNVTSGSIAHDEQCVHCPNGQFQHEAGSTQCYDCPSGKFTATNDINGIPHLHSGCEDCTAYKIIDNTADFDLRHYWTQNEAGWDKCEKKHLDCLSNPWPDTWTTCTRTCRNTITAEVGDQDRWTTPVYHAWGEMAHADVSLRPRLCSATQIVVDTDARQQNYVHWVQEDDKWHQKQECNVQHCPVDCVVTAWGEYDQCTATCGTGSMHKHRTIVRAPMYGGKACPALDSILPCNTHDCVHAVCHNEHVKCHVNYVAYGRTPGGAAAPATTCVGAGCHMCDDALECAAKHIVRTVSVTHDKRFAYVEGDFSCHVEDSDGVVTFNKHLIPEARKNCVCRCSQHPLSCFYKNKVLANSHIPGSQMAGISTKEACSNLCSHHPDCGAWEYDSNKKCILKAGEPVYTDNTNSFVNTYAGAKSGTGGCVQHNKNVFCPLGKYRAEGDGISAYNCITCPAGFTTHMLNAKSCTLALQNTAECPDGEYIATTGHSYIRANRTDAAAVDKKAQCSVCPSGKWNTNPTATDCIDNTANRTYTSHDVQTQTPTSQPTFAPTKNPTVADCSVACAASHDELHQSLEADCLACKGHMTVVDFCATYPTISGC